MQLRHGLLKADRCKASSESLIFFIPLDGMSWTKNAVCVGTPLSWWHTPPGHLTPANRRKIWELCKRCPVKVECKKHAIDTEATGVIQAGHYWSTAHGGQRAFSLQLKDEYWKLHSNNRPTI